MSFRSQFLRGNRAYLIRYLAIGGLTAGVDLATFQLLLVHGTYLPVATTISFILAVGVHFTLNRIWTFKNYERPIVHQVGTYICVLAVSLIITQVVIEILVVGFNVAPILAKGVAIVLQTPVSFFGHRYMTFQAGALAAFRKLRLRSDRSR